MNTAGGSRSLTFSWDQVRRIPLVIPGFLLISAAAHFGAFFLFQVVYPPQASINAPHPSLTVIDPRRPDHQALLRWIDAEDPVPAAAGSTSITDRLLDISYRPSFATMRTAPLAIPEPPQSVLYPPARDPLAIIRSAEQKLPPPPPPPPAKPTRIIFSGELADRTPDSLLPFKANTKVSDAVHPAEFLVGVTDRGEIRFVFLQRPSADSNLVPEATSEAATLDGEAADQLSRVKLKPGGPEITWGHARIEWGPEIYREAFTPKPPSAPKARP